MTDKMNKIVKKIVSAYKTGIPIDFIRKTVELDEDASYKVQHHLVQEISTFFKETIAGYKISMTSPETQALANTNEPAYGTITSASVIKSKESLSLSSMNAPLIEPEIMFILTNDLSRGATEEEILANSKIAAGLEIPDSRYHNWFPNFTLQDLICDNGVTGKIVIGKEVSPPTFSSLSEIEMELFFNQKKIREGLSANVLNNPASSVAWLTKKLATQGQYLRKGMIISSGTFISPIPASVGIYQAMFTSLGDVSIRFTS